MTNEEINQIIAEYCGFEVIRIPFVPAKVKLKPKTVFTIEAANLFYRCYGSSRSINRLQDYCNDLNAMHEAEKVFDNDIHDKDSPRYAYSRHLYSICDPKTQPFRATARQRAEALVRTINKWKE